MEKRLLLAITLSLFILLGYNSLVSKNLYKDERNSFNNEVNQATVKKESVKEIIEEDIIEKTDIKMSNQVSENVQMIENTALRIDISNIGGSIKSIDLKEFNHKLPLLDIFGIEKYKNAVFSSISEHKDSITISYKDSNIEITKTIQLDKDNNLVNIKIFLRNVSPNILKDSLKIGQFTINTDTLDLKSSQNRDYSLYEYSISQNNLVTRKNNAYKFSPKENIEKPGKIDWLGFRDKYFCLIVKPKFDIPGYGISANSEKELTAYGKLNEFNLEPGKSISFEAIVYAGPQDIEKLKSYGSGFDSIISYSSFGLIDWIAKAAVKLLNFINKIVKNWGASILIIGFLVYALMYPLTLKSFSSMRRMQNLQPEIAKIREQNKNNPQKLNKEIMELYKENNVNPLGGCLPFVLQMPVFIGLYQALWRCVYFKGAGFLWIKDLSQPDRLFLLPNELPIIGKEINILPLVMMVVMFFQQKLSSKSMVTADPNQASQQKFMLIFFPVFLGFIFYKFPSGLNLYFTMFYILSTLTQLKMSKLVNK